ncbi:MAG: 4Fe-4S binding protein [Chloroflexi bacterium]|nr:4Fe-4S binding protein [Chloroflexota bacterium]
MLPDVTVDAAKCTDPLSCRACLLVCPNRVLGLGTRVAPRKFAETDPKDFEVQMVRYLSCTLCRQCEAACPTGALSIDEGRVPA